MQIFALLFSLIFILGCNSGVTPAPISTTTTSTSTTTSTTFSTSTSTTTTTSTTTSTTTTTIGCYIGAFVYGLSNTPAFETMIDKNLAINNWFINWSSSFPTANCNIARTYGAVPMLTWEPYLNTTNTLDAISSGVYDDYITQFAQTAKDWNDLVYIKFGAEMNGNWYGWDGLHNSSDPTKFIAAWKHIYNIFLSVGASNVKWVWCVNNSSHPDESWNSYEAYYPGNAYVDWIAIDGYNWGQGNWKTFSVLFDSAYTNLEPHGKPMMIGEFASATDEVLSKADWITDAFYQMKYTYPKIKAFVWFNENKERDWRVESSADSIAAFKNAVSDSYFSGNKPEN